MQMILTRPFKILEYNLHLFSIWQILLISAFQINVKNKIQYILMMYLLTIF